MGYLFSKFSWVILAVVLPAGLTALEVPVRPDVFNPIYEGQYDIKLHCREMTPSAVCKKAATDYHMMILNTDTEAGVIITMNNWKYDVAHYAFRLTHVARLGAEMAGDSTQVHHKPAQAELTVQDDGTVQGWLRSAESTEDFRISGQRVRTPGIFYVDAGAPEKLAPYELLGNYKDERSGAILTVRKPLGADADSYANYIASWHHPSGATIHFTRGEYRPQQGVFNFLTGSGHDLLKWALALRRDSQGTLRWTGVGYSTIKGTARGLDFRNKE